MLHLQHLLWAFIILSFEKRITSKVPCLWAVILNNRIDLFSNEIKPKELPSKVLIQRQTMIYKNIEQKEKLTKIQKYKGEGKIRKQMYLSRI